MIQRVSVLLLFLAFTSSAIAHPVGQHRLEAEQEARQLRLKAFGTREEALAIAVEIGGQALEPALDVLANDSVLLSIIIPLGVSGRVKLTTTQASYTVRLHDKEKERHYLGLLSPGQAFIADPAAPSSSAGLVWAYVKEGFHHILTGYDHLLFVAALTLAAASALNLLAVVGTFTLAHTLTLVLAVVGYAHLDSGIVEPLIAASIVVVALLNLGGARQGLGPRVLGWQRLAVAFGFGLFHGLGFAGGLLEAMQGLQGASQGLALLSFSAGVELGHLSVVLPLYGVLAYLRGKFGKEGWLKALRWGSAGIVSAGLYYLVMALKEA